MAVEEPRRPFTRLDPDSYGRTLGQRLAGRRLTDPLRNLCTRLGVRHYKVEVVRVRWSGGERGSGEPYVVSKLLLEPTPRVEGTLDSLHQSVQGVGAQEVGQLVVDRISTAYGEEHLLGLPRGASRMPVDEESYWELTFFGERGADRRRFQVSGVPSRKTLGWRVELDRSFGFDREPISGDPALSKPTYEEL